MIALAVLCAVLPAVGAAKPARDVAGQEMLIVHDTPAPVKVLAEALGSKARLKVTAAEQDKLPNDLGRFIGVIQYVHGPLTESVERACMAYARNGGRLVMLHHGISSSKRSNPEMLKELTCAVPPGGREKNAFYVDRGTLTLVNVAPDHFITTHAVKYDGRVRYPPDDAEAPRLDALSFENTEVFLNLDFPQCPERTLLYAITFRDKDGTVFAQPTGGWMMKIGKGYAFYFQPGHEARDFASEPYQQIITNCVLWQP